MASGIIKIEGYKTGETITRFLRSVGRIVIAGNAIYTSISLDKPIYTNNVSLTISAVNLYKTEGGIVYASGDITVNNIIYNTIAFTIPISSVETGGTVIYCESNIKITFN